MNHESRNNIVHVQRYLLYRSSLTPLLIGCSHFKRPIRNVHKFSACVRRKLFLISKTRLVFCVSRMHLGSWEGIKKPRVALGQLLNFLRVSITRWRTPNHEPFLKCHMQYRCGRQHRQTKDRGLIIRLTRSQWLNYERRRSTCMVKLKGILKAPSAAAIRQLTTDHSLDYSLFFKIILVQLLYIIILKCLYLYIVIMNVDR